jgi:DNA topoisomerase-1
MSESNGLKTSPHRRGGGGGAGRSHPGHDRPSDNSHARKIVSGALRRAEQGPPSADPVESARAAGLRYVTADAPGIRRVRAGTGFKYVGPGGKPVADEETLGRIKSLVIPPAWTDLWICADPRGHLQAVGRDQRGRKQYRYHPRFREVRDENKYEKMIAFVHALPAIRRRVSRDLARPGLPREKVLAAVVRLLETTLIRVGNEEYADQNKSYGLTTLQDRHAKVSGSHVRFRFRGKSGVAHDIELDDPRLAKIIRKSQDLPGQELLQYQDEDGQVRDIGSGDVNEYLRDITGENFTAKDFRTWAGTVLAARALEEFKQVDSQAQAKKNVVNAIEAVAAKLGNTRAVCRKCYVHPAVIDSYLDGSLLKHLGGEVRKMIKPLHQLRPEEAAVLVLLQKRLADEQKQQRRQGRARAGVRSAAASRGRHAAAA